MAVRKQYPFEVRAARFVIDPFAFKEPLHEDQRGALGLVIVAIDQGEPSVPRTIV
jgi:hypothetical protein